MVENHVRTYIDSISFLFKLAQEEVSRAISYRDFRVGCAILYFFQGQYLISIGHNIKPTKDAAKYCAEKDARKNVPEGAEIIAVIVVANQTQEDKVARKNPPVLHPCGVCRQMLSDLAGKGISSGTIIYCAGVDGKIAQEFTYEEFVEYYQSSLYS